MTQSGWVWSTHGSMCPVGEFHWNTGSCHTWWRRCCW